MALTSRGKKPEPAKEEPKKGSKPDYVARARQSPDSEFYSNIGAAWERTNEKGETFISVKLNSQPTNWDGSFLLMRPLPDRE